MILLLGGKHPLIEQFSDPHTKSPKSPENPLLRQDSPDFWPPLYGLRHRHTSPTEQSPLVQERPSGGLKQAQIFRRLKIKRGRWRMMRMMINHLPGT